MTKQTSKKGRGSTAGVKALIVSGSIAATVAGWALLPANDPQPAGAASDPAGAGSVPAAPGASDSGVLAPAALPTPDTQAPAYQAPAYQDPQANGPAATTPNYSQFPAPFARTRSSR